MKDKTTFTTLGWILTAIALVCAIAVIVVLAQTRPPITKTAGVTLTVLQKPTYSLTVTPAHIDAYVGRSADVSYGASVTSVNGFAGVVNFSISGLVPGLTATFVPANVLTLGAGETKAVQINIAIADDVALVGNYSLTVTATSTSYN